MSNAYRSSKTLLSDPNATDVFDQAELLVFS